MFWASSSCPRTAPTRAKLSHSILRSVAYRSITHAMPTAFSFWASACWLFQRKITSGLRFMISSTLTVKFGAISDVEIFAKDGSRWGR